MRTVALLFFTLVLSACAGTPVVKLYEGAERPSTELLVVRVPMELEVLMINDQPVSGAAQVFTYGNRELHMAPGSYRIVAFYKNLFQINADEHEVIKTNPAQFVVEGAAGDVFQLGFEKPVDLEAAQAMEENFRGWVRNERTGEQVAGEKTGLMISRGFTSVLPGTQVVTGSADTVAPEPSPTTGSAADSTGDSYDGQYLDLLKAHWRAATAEERRAFLKWMGDAPPPAQ